MTMIRGRLRSAVAPAYFKYRSLRADWLHQSDSEAYACAPKADAPSHVLVLVIDALRPDAIPDLDLDFTTAVTPAPWTFPAMTSIHTGQYPHEHGAVAHTRSDDEEYAIPAQADPEQHLPGTFEAMGYSTGCFAGFLMPLLAVEGWYETHHTFRQARAEEVIDTYRGWRRGRERTFAYVHLGDLHEPLNPPEKYVYGVDTSIPRLATWAYTDDFDGGPDCERYRSERLELYGASLNYVEDKLARLVEELGNDTLLVITADHGEAHWEHYELDRAFSDSRPNYGVGHGGTPFDAVARVPVAVHGPVSGSIEPGPGWPSLRDLPKTLLSRITDDDLYPGRDWAESIPPERWVLCEGTRYGSERKAIYRGDEKVIHSRTDEVTLFATVDRWATGEHFTDDVPDSAADLVEILERVWDADENAQEVGGIVQEQLKALGYK